MKTLLLHIRALIFLLIAGQTTNDLAWKKKVCRDIGHASMRRSFPGIPGDYRRECSRCQVNEDRIKGISADEYDRMYLNRREVATFFRALDKK